MKQIPIILAIDTSCDDTSVAITQGVRVLSNIVASQEEIHRKYGGVYPLAAKLAHHELIDPTYNIALKRAKIKPEQIDLIAVTQGPGLAIALEVGIEFAKQLALDLNKPLVAVNHMAGHMYSPLAVNSRGNPEPKPLSLSSTEFSPYQGRALEKDIINIFPALSLLVSGGHTELILLKSLTEFQKIGQTLDDAAGECLDKFARLLDLGYPGAAAMEEIAKKGDSKAYKLPIPMIQSKDLNFSFSGLKTAGRVLIEKLSNPKGSFAPIPRSVAKAMKRQRLEHKGNKYISSGEKQADTTGVLSPQDIADLAASFQYAVIKAIIYKLKIAIEIYKPKSIWLGGGVSANKFLRHELRNITRINQIAFLYPKLKRLNGDNAAMIGIAGYFEYLKGNTIVGNENPPPLEASEGHSFRSLQRNPRMSL